MEEFDAIIIGSGAGGLTTAICLAKAEKTLVPGTILRTGRLMS